MKTEDGTLEEDIDKLKISEKDHSTRLGRIQAMFDSTDYHSDFRYGIVKSNLHSPIDIEATIKKYRLTPFDIYLPIETANIMSDYKSNNYRG